MKKKEVSGILIDVKKGNVCMKTIDESSLQDFYDILDCRCIDITQRYVGGKAFTFVCDDEGLLIDNPIVSAINSAGEPMLVGNLFICNTKGSHLKSLSDEEANVIFDNMMIAAIGDGNDVHISPVLGNVEYTKAKLMPM